MRALALPFGGGFVAQEFYDEHIAGEANNYGWKTTPPRHTLIRRRLTHAALGGTA